MNNTVVQRNNVSYINMGNWYIGIHYNNNNELCIFVDHNEGAVESDEIKIAEDESQWAVRLHRVPARDERMVGGATTLRRSVRVRVED